MSIINYDLIKLYERTFGSKPYKIPADDQSEIVVTGYDSIPRNNHAIDAKQAMFSDGGHKLMEMYKQREIWLPTKFIELDATSFPDGEFYLPFCAVKITGKKTIVKTPMAERQGTVKELYSIDDYVITLKGFFIDINNRIWPEDDLQALKKVYETNAAITIENALVDTILGKETQVVMVSFELPEVEGGRKHVRPFNIQLESDSIFTLEV